MQLVTQSLPVASHNFLIVFMIFSMFYGLLKKSQVFIPKRFYSQHHWCKLDKWLKESHCTEKNQFLNKIDLLGVLLTAMNTLDLLMHLCALSGFRKILKNIRLFLIYFRQFCLLTI